MSAAFFAAERRKLEAFREDVRSVRAGNVGEMQATHTRAYVFVCTTRELTFTAAAQSEAHGLNLLSLKERLTPQCRVVRHTRTHFSLQHGRFRSLFISLSFSHTHVQTVWHSERRAFFNGVVVGSDYSRYEVHFDEVRMFGVFGVVICPCINAHTQGGLGRQWVPDTDVALHELDDERSLKVARPKTRRCFHLF